MKKVKLSPSKEHLKNSYEFEREPYASVERSQTILVVSVCERDRITRIMADHQVACTLIRSFVSSYGELSMNACYVVRALSPLFPDEREVRIKLTPLLASFPFGKGSRCEPVADRAMPHTHTLGNSRNSFRFAS
jgi:hypothetical protein